MRVRSYVLTGALIAVALGAPFALPRVLDSQGSAAFGLQAAAPPAARAAIVRMAALPQPKRVARARPVLARATPHVAHATSRAVDSGFSGASLASVRVGTAPAAPARTTIARHWIRRHPPAPVETRRAPDPAPAAPTASVVALTPQPVNLNASSATASAPAPEPLPSPVQGAPAPAATGNGRDDHQHDDRGQGRDHGHGHDH
jgi:hypothetical protein